MPLPPRWAKEASRDLGGAPAETLLWSSPEGVVVKPIYTADDVADLSPPGMPGEFPFTRGVRASLYTVRPWTIRQVLPRRGARGSTPWKHCRR